MFFGGLLTAFVIAFALTLALALLFDRRGPGPMGGIFFFFGLVFLATWAGGVWVVPGGPFLWGVSWLGFLLVGLITALVLAAALPPRRRRLREEEVEGAPVEATLGGFFYLAMAALLVVILAFYIF